MVFPKIPGMPQALKEARLKANLSQTDIALALGVKPQFISNWERGMSNPPLRLLVSFCKETSASIDDFRKIIHEGVDLEISRQGKPVRKARRSRGSGAATFIRKAKKSA